jgi:hypothetical protein
MGAFIREPKAVPRQPLIKELAGGTDVIEMADLNAPTLDCTFHESYCLQEFNTNYVRCLIACEPPLAFINYQQKGVCT